MNSKEARRKLKTLGVEPPLHCSVCRHRGDTFRILAGDPQYIQSAAKALRKAGYWAQVHIPTNFAGLLLFNLVGTEWQDGMIPENLAALPLRGDPPKQMAMFDGEGTDDE